MKKTKIKKQAIYLRHRKHGDDCYMLVLGVSNSGMNVMYLASTSKKAYYENIDGIYLENLDLYAAFDRNLYIGWNKCRMSEYTEVCTIPYRKLSTITTAVKQYFDGQIVTDEKGFFHYYDDIDMEKSAATSSTDNINNDVEVTVNVTSASLGMESEHSISVSISDNPTIHHDKTEFIDDNDAIIDGFNAHGIPVDILAGTSDNKRYFDLLECDDKDTKYKSSAKIDKDHKKRKYNRTTAEHRRMFSEDETLAISNMAVKMIITKYNVPYHVACIMRVNARRHMGFEVSKKPRKHSFKELFDKGYLPEDIKKEYPEVDIGHINANYRSYMVSKSDNDSNTVIEYFDQVISERRIDEMISAVNMSNIKFRETYNCTYNVAISIARKIKDILCINPLFAAGFDNLAYDDNISTIIDNIRSSKKKPDIVMVRNYDTCMRLSSAYTSSYNDHADILAGMIPVPEEVDESDIGRFLSLLNNRFSRKFINSIRTLTSYQKDLIKNGDNVDVGCELMISCYPKITNLRRKFNRSA